MTTKLSTTDRVTIASLANTLAHRWLVPRPIRFKIHDYVFMTGGNKWRDQTTRLIIPPFFPEGNTRLDWPDGAQSASRARSSIEDGVANSLPIYLRVDNNYCLICLVSGVIYLVTKEKRQVGYLE